MFFLYKTYQTRASLNQSAKAQKSNELQYNMFPPIYLPNKELDQPAHSFILSAESSFSSQYNQTGLKVHL